MPQVGQFWRYDGPAPYQGITHQVVEADGALDDIITVFISGIWRGSRALFANHFKFQVNGPMK